MGGHYDEAECTCTLQSSSKWVTYGLGLVIMHHAMNSNAYTMCHVLCILCRQYESEILRENRVDNDKCNI